MELLASYPYLGACLLMLLVSAFAALFCIRGQWLPMLLSSTLTVPVSMFASLYVPDYWDPVLILGGDTGPEDFLFGLANGATVWVLATRALGRPLVLRLHILSMIGRYLPLLLGGLLLYFCLSGFGMRPMNATLLVNTAITAVLLTVRADLRRMVLPTALGFALLYALLTLTTMRFWPHLSDQWNHERLWGVAVGGVPLEEFVWGLAFGATWPLIAAYVTDVRPANVWEPVPELHNRELTETSTEAREG